MEDELVIFVRKQLSRQGVPLGVCPFFGCTVLFTIRRACPGCRVLISCPSFPPCSAAGQHRRVGIIGTVALVQRLGAAASRALDNDSAIGACCARLGGGWSVIRLGQLVDSPTLL